MAVRDVIEIDEELCDGCGLCVPACAEGAIAVVDGKARLISDVYCDGLGACLGECPQGAISVVQRDAEEFDELAVERHLASRGHRTQAPAGTTELPMVGAQGPVASACPGSRVQRWSDETPTPAGTRPAPSRLRQWPIQLHLVPPTAPFFQQADVLLAADCVAYSVGGFHDQFLNGHSLAIACPKLDSHQEIYLEKLVSMIDDAHIRSLEILVMEVPCCSGLIRLVEQARTRARRDVPVRFKVVGVQGEVLGERSL